MQRFLLYSEEHFYLTPLERTRATVLEALPAGSRPRVLGRSAQGRDANALGRAAPSGFSGLCS
jgi:hypothetical protein